MDYWYDVEAFEAGVEQADNLVRDDPQQAMETLETATQLYRGEFLLDIVGDEWGARAGRGSSSSTPFRLPMSLGAVFPLL